jgi:hypothetical protein
MYFIHFSFELDDPDRSLIDVPEGIFEEEADKTDSSAFLKRLSDTKYEITTKWSHFAFPPFLPQGQIISVVLSLFFTFYRVLEPNPFHHSNYERYAEMIIAQLGINRLLI